MRELIGSPDDGERSFEGMLGNFEGALLHFNDWDTYPPDAKALVHRIRQGHGEIRDLIEAPAHLFSPNESAEFIAHCYMTDLFCWTAYAYLANKKATLQFWEGDLVDCWLQDENLYEEVKKCLLRFNLKLT